MRPVHPTIGPASDRRDGSLGLEALAREVARRRTFAIISHPDAGKTTLTEKLLLYAGAIQLAGAVRGRKTRRHATSDWMAIEQARGISVTSTALQFDYGGCRLNLLDTPGHQDFSEDTYRTLVAVDSAVMVLDSAKGVEPQTRKLFEVCRRRGIPILTFVNKLDLPGRDPMELLDEIEDVLGIGAAPMNWPIGDGPTFLGVYDLARRQVLRFERTIHGEHRAPVVVTDLERLAVTTGFGEPACRRLREEAELLEAAGARFDRETFLAGRVTPVFFGSAVNNFGVEPFLDALVALAPPPGPRPSDRGPVDPVSDLFSGFVFKIQANMDRQHRDRMAFLRVCSGRFEKDMVVYHARLGRNVRVSRTHRLFARERESIDEAYPGDVVGLVNPGLFAIGDTLTSGPPLSFEPVPAFQPECFAVLRNRDVSRHKQFHAGLRQLEEEGAVQLLSAEDGSRREPILAAVGELQFDVVRARLLGEYGTDTEIDRLRFQHARWCEGPREAVAAVTCPGEGILHVRDHEGRAVILFPSDWALDYCVRRNPEVSFEARGETGASAPLRPTGA